MTISIPSLALRIARVADARIDGVITKPGPHHWDLAAADLIVQVRAMADPDRASQADDVEASASRPGYRARTPQGRHGCRTEDRRHASPIVGLAGRRERSIELGLVYSRFSLFLRPDYPVSQLLLAGILESLARILNITQCSSCSSGMLC